MILETERLFLREMTEDDYDALYAVLGDSDMMQHYPYTFNEVRVRNWITRNRERYARDGFGLWAVCLRDSGEMIGDCGLTLQMIDGQQLPEIGYHIRRDQQRRSYAREAAAAVRDWAFAHTEYPALYSYCKYTNEPSWRTVEAIGMHFLKEYPDDANGITHVSAITKKEYLLMTAERMLTIQKADQSNFQPDSLDDFSRFQTVTNVYRLQGGQLVLVHQPFTEDWSPERKREKAAEVLSGSFITFCAFEHRRVLGCIMLVPELNKGRMIVHSFHVSADQRRRGLGRRLFEAAKAEARNHQASALYISACSSEETIRFYLSIGCHLSPNPILAMVEDEPWDIQLEYDLEDAEHERK